MFRNFLTCSFLIVLMPFCFSQVNSQNIVKRDLAQIDNTAFSNLPLEVGNMWLYRVHYYTGAMVYSYSYSTTSVSSSTIINGKKYYQVNFPTGAGLYRYSNEDNKLYRSIDNNDFVIMDFNKAAGDTFHQHINQQISRVVTVRTGIDSFFNSGIQYKGFIYDAPDQSQVVSYHNNLGPLYYSNFSLVPQADSKARAINVLLYDSIGNSTYYSYGVKPYFANLNPILLISNANFSINFNVLHQYNVYSSVPFAGYNFISSVKFESYYQKEDSVVTALNFFLSPINWPRYNVSITLDTILMRSGFSFFYRFIARDKQIIPEIAYSPDTGYYKCIWQPLSIQDEDNVLANKIILFQNYPNPFNPSTVISYKLPVNGKISLKIYDVLGKEVASLVDGYREAGKYEIEFPNVETSYASSLPSGIYFYQLKFGQYVQTKKMILVK